MIYFNVLTPSHKGATGIHKMTLSEFEKSHHTWNDVISIVEEEWQGGRLHHINIHETPMASALEEEE